MPLLYLESQGCQMNERDAERLAGGLLRIGWRLTDDPAQADLILLNTCSVRDKARTHALGRLGQLVRHRRRKPNLLLGMTGCLAKHLGADARQSLPFLNLVAGPGAVERLPRLVEQLESPTDFVVDTNPADPPGEFDPTVDLRLAHPAVGSHAAFVTITEGCDNYCAYCIVPYLRGAMRARPAEAILTECRYLLDSDYTELTLLGQNVNAYAAGEFDFPRLLREIAQMDGLRRLRFTSSHPKDLSEATLRVMAEEPAICEHLHLALQSGSDSVLTAMGRKYTAGHFGKLIATARRLIPGLAVTTDIIVGYPGEGEADFAQTLALVEELSFDNAFMFKYSPRAGTASAQLKDDVPAEVKQARLEQIIAAVTASAKNNNAGLVGQRLSLIVEGRDKKNRCFGRTRGNKNVKLDSDHEPGTLLTVEITSAGAFSLIGTVIDEGMIDG